MYHIHNTAGACVGFAMWVQDPKILKLNDYAAMYTEPQRHYICSAIDIIFNVPYIDNNQQDLTNTTSLFKQEHKNIVAKYEYMFYSLLIIRQIVLIDNVIFLHLHFVTLIIFYCTFCFQSSFKQVDTYTIHN